MLRKCVVSTLPLKLLQRHWKAILDAHEPLPGMGCMRRGPWILPSA